LSPFLSLVVAIFIERQRIEMLRSGKNIRFTSAEIDEARRLGLDLSTVQTDEQLVKALLQLIGLLEQERPALLEKLAVELAAMTGRKLPARLTAVE
jgi:hypothetical protein